MELPPALDKYLGYWHKAVAFGHANPLVTIGLAVIGFIEGWVVREVLNLGFVLTWGPFWLLWAFSLYTLYTRQPAAPKQD
jgi:hypothetical protein